MSRGIDRPSSDIAPFRLNASNTMRLDAPKAKSTPNASSHIFQLAEQASIRKEVTKFQDRSGPKQQIEGMVESTPNASGAIFQLAEVAALRKEGAHLQGQRIRGMVSGKPNAAKATKSVADLNVQLASQASGRKKKTKIPREARTSSEFADTPSRANGNINGGAVRPGPQTHFQQFFARYPLFQYDPSAPVSAQFQAMCRKYGFPRPGRKDSWEAKSELELEADAARAGFRLAMVRTFNDLFGTDVNDLKNWQSFCTVLEISPVPTKLRDCRAAVRDVHVNLVDLVDWGIAKAEIHKFETLDELSEYTRNTGKFFPQSEAEAGGMLRFLLRRIL